MHVPAASFSQGADSTHGNLHLYATIGSALHRLTTMRICSLLPSATEIIYALGLGGDLVGVSHECDYPPEARSKPILTGSRIDHTGRSGAEIDSLVSTKLHEHSGIY